MNYAIIDNNKKSSFFRIKPEKFTFHTGHNLYIFPGLCRKNQLYRVLSRYDCSFFPNECNFDMKLKIWCKIIIQCMKEYGLKEITFCSLKYMKYINFLNSFFNKSIDFSLMLSGDSNNVIDYFLETYGFPVSTKIYVQRGLIVYIDGPVPQYEKNVKILDLNTSLDCEKIVVSEFLLKNISFPIKIDSLPVLEGALELTAKEIEDIIIKLCIIGTNCE